MTIDVPTTSLSAFNENGATIRGFDLVNDLIGSISFTEMIYLYLIGRKPSAKECQMLDAILVTMVDHGIPAGLTARLTLRSAPESLQGAVAAGLLGVGSQFGGVMQNAGELLARIVDEPLDDATLTDYVRSLRTEGEPIPGFGHPDFRPIDPRAQRLLKIAEELALSGLHIEALCRLSNIVEAVVGKPVTVNVTGAISAILSDMELNPMTMRGISLIARTPGLVGQLKEETEQPIANYFQQRARTDVIYRDHSVVRDENIKE